jgi:hypothetical protein
MFTLYRVNKYRSMVLNIFFSYSVGENTPQRTVLTTRGVENDILKNIKKSPSLFHPNPIKQVF